mmetsp:Transcript_12375/g.13702  ORF Transcript_12375/g.13702 Transcript_12375/m.13702 type:complete len:136 (+) Transcript_12375:635-1042(+)
MRNFSNNNAVTMKVDLNKLLDRAEDYTLAGELQEGNTTRVVSNVRQAALPRIPRCSLKTHKQQTTAAIQQMKMNINELVRLQVCHQTNPGIHASYEANEAFIHQRVRTKHYQIRLTFSRWVTCFRRLLQARHLRW